MCEKVFFICPSWYLDPIHPLWAESGLDTSPGQSVWPPDSHWTHWVCLKHRTGTNWCHPQHWETLCYEAWKGWGAFPLPGSGCPCNHGSSEDVGAGDTVPCAARRRVRGYPAHISWLRMSHLLLITSPDYCCALGLNFQPRGERLLHLLGY